MRKFTTEIKVGFFVIIAVIVLGYMTFKIGELTFGREKGYLIYGVFESVARLDIKSPVKMAGVAVGSIEGITLSGEKAKVAMKINPDVKIRKGVVAAIKSESLLGEKYLDLIPGKEEEFLKGGDIIYKTISVADLDSLISQLQNVAEDIKSISGFFKETLGTPETQSSINEIITNLRNMTESLSILTEKESGAIDTIIRNLGDLVVQMRNIAEENKGPFKNAITNLEKISGDLGDIARENKTPLRDTMANLQELSGDLKTSAPRLLNRVDRLVDKVEKGEGTVGKLLKEDGLYEKLDSTLTGINKYVTATDSFKLNVGFRGEYLFDGNNTKGYFSLRLQPREDKYYLFEVVDDPRGRVKVTDTKVATTPGTTIDTREIRREDELKFSALFARKFGDVILRGGLMESTFGFGADYYIKGEQLRTSVDAWNFDGDPDAKKPHLKLTVNYMVFKSLFINAGIDDFVNSKMSGTFAGAGLSFDDEDLKYILTRLPISLP